MNLNEKRIFVIACSLLGFLIFARFSPISGAECDNMPTDNPENTRLKIECLTQKVTQLSSQANTLKNQIAQFDYQIRLATLKIAQTQSQIDVLDGRIDLLTSSLEDLTKAFSSRAVETYKLSRFENNLYFILASSDLAGAASRFHYLQRIADEDRNLINRLQSIQSNYQTQKQDQEVLKAQLKDQQSKLNSQKIAKNNLLTATRNDEARFQSLLAQAKSQLAAFNRFVLTQGGASILSGQTKCDSWGCYYNQRDSQWGNIGMGGSSYSTAGYGCLVTSVSMVASHFGKNIKPGDVAVNAGAFVPGTGYLYHSFSVNGINVKLSTASTSLIDSELNAGRPVIAGLYSGPDHFVVIIKKEGDKYIMHDPFLENGSNRVLTEKYAISDIKSIRLYSFN